MKSTPGGYFMVQESGTNDLVIFTSKGEFKNRVQAASAFPFGNRP